MSEYYAAFGSNGIDYVAWGLGRTQDSALRDASLWLTDTLTDTPLTVHAVTVTEYHAIERGDVSVPARLDVEVAAAHKDGYDDR